MGNIGISRENPDFYAVSVMNYILGGGGFASRLLEEIRNKRGSLMTSRVLSMPASIQVPFQIVLQTKNASATEAISLGEAANGADSEGACFGQGDRECKKYLVGSFPLRLDTQGKLAAFFSRCSTMAWVWTILKNIPP